MRAPLLLHCYTRAGPERAAGEPDWHGQDSLPAVRDAGLAQLARASGEPAAEAAPPAALGQGSPGRRTGSLATSPAAAAAAQAEAALETVRAQPHPTSSIVQGLRVRCALPRPVALGTPPACYLVLLAAAASGTQASPLGRPELLSQPPSPPRLRKAPQAEPYALPPTPPPPHPHLTPKPHTHEAFAEHKARTPNISPNPLAFILLPEPYPPSPAGGVC
jgi:hypothetical protein